MVLPLVPASLVVVWRLFSDIKPSNQDPQGGGPS